LSDVNFVPGLDLTGLVLEIGSHADKPGYCAMEACALYCGEPKTDHPRCASATLGAFVRRINDWSAYARRELVSRIPKLAVSADKDAVHAARRARLLADRALETAKRRPAAAAAARAAAARAADKEWAYALETLDLALELA
jgi:hypothetical protein